MDLEEAKNGDQRRTGLMKREPASTTAPTQWTGSCLSLPARRPPRSPSLPSMSSSPEAFQGPASHPPSFLCHQCEASLCTLKSDFTPVVQMISCSPCPEVSCPASSWLNT